MGMTKKLKSLGTIFFWRNCDFTFFQSLRMVWEMRWRLSYRLYSEVSPNYLSDAFRKLGYVKTLQAFWWASQTTKSNMVKLTMVPKEELEKIAPRGFRPPKPTWKKKIPDRYEYVLLEDNTTLYGEAGFIGF